MGLDAPNCLEQHAENRVYGFMCIVGKYLISLTFMLLIVAQRKRLYCTVSI